MTKTQVNSLPSSNEYPVSPEKLISIIEKCLPDTSPYCDVAAYTKLVLAELDKASSVHKFVISVTKIDAAKGYNFDLGIDSYVGGAWNKATDGAFTHAFEPIPGLQYLMTIVWLSKKP
ncbi:LAME_0F13476g1_1 [Lachancea meyersii CBS 8951]|uniref:LAME_0F13476g1_1 n=1 Tax=Lachancea meyersii CBS 8951 TaxID=1266667 RepID=A0A1G4JXF2_9SACH|nr:LAME_0F13476g1_1 [Lachancea meyersii CBS 8951]